MHDCPCCSEAVYSDDITEICSCCSAADCEPGTDGVYADCQIPSCPVCDTRSTYCTDEAWHRNCQCSS